MTECGPNLLALIAWHSRQERQLLSAIEAIFPGWEDECEDVAALLPSNVAQELHAE